MARLIILSEAQMGRSHELTMEKTTIGRVEDNSFQIPEASVSSHHAEVVLRPNDILVRDLNSTNGTFINGQQVTGEAPLKPGQILRLGQIELSLEMPGAGTAGAPPKAAAPAASAPPRPTPPPSAPAASPAKKLPDQTMVIPQGVKLGQDNGTNPGAFEKSGFSKKGNMGTKIYIGAAILVMVIIVLVIFYMMHQANTLGTN